MPKTLLMKTNFLYIFPVVRLSKQVSLICFVMYILFFQQKSFISYNYKDTNYNTKETIIYEANKLSKVLL